MRAIKAIFCHGIRCKPPHSLSASVGCKHSALQHSINAGVIVIKWLINDQFESSLVSQTIIKDCEIMRRTSVRLFLLRRIAHKSYSMYITISMSDVYLINVCD